MKTSAGPSTTDEVDFLRQSLQAKIDKVTRWNVCKNNINNNTTAMIIDVTNKKLLMLNVIDKNVCNSNK